MSYKLLEAGRWLPVPGCRFWLQVACCRSLAAGRQLLVARCWSLGIGRWPLLPKIDRPCMRLALAVHVVLPLVLLSLAVRVVLPFVLRSVMGVMCVDAWH